MKKNCVGFIDVVVIRLDQRTQDLIEMPILNDIQSSR